MIATPSGAPAKTKLVPIGGKATCLRKKMGKNLMVMPAASPPSMSDMARKYGTALLPKLLFVEADCCTSALLFAADVVLGSVCNSEDTGFVLVHQAFDCDVHNRKTTCSMPE